MRRTTSSFLATVDNIRFNYGFEVFNVCCGPRSTLMSDATWRAIVSTEGHNKP